MLALLGTIALLAPVDVVLLPQGDALLLACHDDQAGWFTGRACVTAAAGASVHQAKGKPFTLPQVGKHATCGGTEGHFAFGAAPGDGPVFSAHRAPRACPERKPYSLPPKVAKAVQAALVADLKANPTAYQNFDHEAAGAPPIADTFSMNRAIEIDIEGKGQVEQVVSVTDLRRKLTALVRLNGTSAKVLRVNPYGILEVGRGDCGDFDGDGVAELVVTEGGETERVYLLLRFVRGEADVVTSIGCGD